MNALATIALPPSPFEEPGIQLPLVPAIEKGFGVVPILSDGSALFRPGEVAVYREERRGEFIAGYYCLEIQRPMMWSLRPRDKPREVERQVVWAQPYTGRGKVSDDSWEYYRLESKVVRGRRYFAQPEGPLYWWAWAEMLLGPIVGIYAPTPIAEGR